VSEVNAAEGEWINYIDGQHNDILTEIHKSEKLEDETAKKLDTAMESFKKSNSELFTEEE